VSGRTRTDQFLGRDVLLDEVARAVVSRERLVVFDVYGPGGVGKTALLDELASRVPDPAQRTLRLSFRELAPSVAGAPDAELLTAYRRILETLAEQLVGERADPFKERVRALSKRASSGPGLDVARDEMSDAFLALIAEAGDDPVLLLGDDISSLASSSLIDWLLELFRDRAARRPNPLVAVLTRSGAPDERLDYAGRVVPVALRAFSAVEAAALISERTPERRWADAAARWSGGYPGAVSLAAQLASEYPNRPEVLDDVAVVAPRGAKLLDALLDSLGHDVDRAAVEIGAVTRRFDTQLIESVLADLDLTAPAYLERWLTQLPFVETLDDGRYRLRPFLQLLLTERLRTESPRRPNEKGTRLDELHQLVTAAHQERVAGDAQDRRYCSWLRFEDPAAQERQLELLHHCLRAPTVEFGWRTLVHTYFDAFWWWGAYIESDFCRRQLDLWEQQARPRDQRLLVALQQFQASYPPFGESREGDWETVTRSIAVIGEETGLWREPGKLTPDECHVRAILEVFLGQSHRFRDLEDPGAETRFGDALALFERRPEDSWCLPWVVYEQADLAVARNRHPEAEALALDGLRRAREAPDSERDYEVEANLHRVLGDAQWARDQTWTAFKEYAKALFCAYSFNGLPDPPDEYTRRFYREITGRTLDRVVGLLPDRRAARRACTAFAAFWTPYWDGDPPTERSIDTLLHQSPRDVAVCLFPSAPSDHDLEHGHAYVQKVEQVHRKLRNSLDEAVKVFGRDGFFSRLGREPPAVPPLELPTGSAEPDQLFEPREDPIWPDHWRTFPPRWRDLAARDEHRAEVRALIDRSIAELPDTWRTVLSHRDLEGWTYQDVARRVGVSGEHQTLMLHHARARVRAALAEYFAEAGA
jgi:hypothetical protein